MFDYKRVLELFIRMLGRTAECYADAMLPKLSYTPQATSSLGTP